MSALKINPFSVCSSQQLLRHGQFRIIIFFSNIIGYCVRIPICAWNFSICWKTFSIPKHSLPQALRNCKNRLLSDARARWRYIKFGTFTPTIVCRVMMTGIFLSQLFINSLIIVNDGNHNVTGNPQNLHVFQENPFPGLSTQHTSSVRSLCPTIFGVRGY